jgi:hypothetical protein
LILMARTKKHIGFGRFEVYEDGEKIAGPVAKEEAEALVLAPPASLNPKAKMTDLEWERAYWKRVNADIGQPVSDDMAKIAAIIDGSSAGYTEVERTNMKHQIEAVLKSRGQKAWRSRNTVLPAPAQAAA